MVFFLCERILRFRLDEIVRVCLWSEGGKCFGGENIVCEVLEVRECLEF